MAHNPEARALTEAHKLLQIALGESYVARAISLLGMIDMDAIGATSQAWAVEMHALMQEGYLLSAEQAAQYLTEFRAVEAGITDGPIVRPRMGSDHIIDELLNLADDMQSLREAGHSEGMISDFAASRIEGYVQRGVLNGGRNTIRASSRANVRAFGWLRVSDGNPCAFCAMLVGRGPVYKAETVGFRSHDYCGCTAEEFYGEKWSDWEPTGEEARWRDVYFEVAEIATATEGRRVAPKPGMSEDTILWRMRRHSPNLFSDGVHPKV